MEWLIRETERGGPQLFKAGSSNPARGASASLLFLPDLKSLTGEMIMAAPAPCGCRVYFLVPISHPATATGRDAYCVFLNVGN
jgi:hypothetical protein